jgi:hypothetical protein
MIKRLIVCCALIVAVTSCKKEKENMSTPATPSMKSWVKQNIPNSEVNSQAVSANEVFIITTVTAQAPRYTSESAIAVISNKDPDAGRFFSYSVTGQAGYDIITLNFAKLRETATKGQVIISKINSVGTAIPLERKTAFNEDGQTDPITDKLYQTYWNHNVVGDKKATGFDEAKWKKIGLNSSDEEGEGLDVPTGQEAFMWSKSNQGVNTNKKVFLNANKPGVQSFLQPFIELQQTIYTLNYDRVEEAVGGVGTRWDVDAPDYKGSGVFGILLTDADYWLKSSAKTSKENGHWRIDVVYKFAPFEWDQDLYAKEGVK